MTPPTYSHICPLGVGKGVLDCLSVSGVKREGSSAVVTSGDPGNPPSWMLGTSVDLSIQPLLRLRCGGYGWHLTALTMRLLLLLLRAPLRSRVCFQWVLANCGLLGNKRADEEGRKAADLGLDDGAQRGKISFEVVKGLIRSQVKGGPPSHAHTSQVYGDGPFKHLQGASRREEVLLAQLRSGCSLLLGETRKRIQGTDSTCPHCREEEDFEHVLRACSKLESPRRKNPHRSRPCQRTRRKWPGISGRSSIGISRDCSLLYKQTK
jgi:hypothetical protein